MSSEEMFAVFYSEYPRHLAKKDAQKAFGKLDLTEEGFGRMMAALRLQKRTIWRGKDAVYIPYPATWIRGERWEDEIESGHVHDERCRDYGFCQEEAWT